MRPAGRPALALLALALTACPDEGASPDDPERAEAGVVEAPPSSFEDDATGVRFSWPTSWRRAPAPSRPDDGGVMTLAKIVRADLVTPVAPRIELTREGTTLEDPELAARRTKNVLEASLESAGAKIRRVSLSRRALGGRFVGVLDLEYAVPTEPRGPTAIRHRALVARVELSEGALAIVTLNATYLARDHDLIGAEVDAVFDSFSVPAPTASPPNESP